MGRAPRAIPTGLVWIGQIFASKQARSEGVVRRSRADVLKYASFQALRTEVRKRGKTPGGGLIFCLPRREATRFKLTVVVPPDIDGLPSAELKQLVLKLLEENAEQTRVMAELREEIARLKGLKGRPPIKPSGMENGTSPKPGGRRGRRRRRGKVVPRVKVEEQILKTEVPEGSRLKGYEDFVVQDLELRVRVIR